MYTRLHCICIEWLSRNSVDFGWIVDQPDAVVSVCGSYRSAPSWVNDWRNNRQPTEENWRKSGWVLHTDTHTSTRTHAVDYTQDYKWSVITESFVTTVFDHACASFTQFLFEKWMIDYISQGSGWVPGTVTCRLFYFSFLRRHGLSSL